MKFKNEKYLTRFERLDGKTAVITGASGVIGRQIAVNFLLLGAKVILPVISEGEREELRADFLKNFDETRFETPLIDLTDKKSIDEFVSGVKDKSLNFLINNAGAMGKLDFAVNFFGTLYLTLKLTPLLNKHTDSCVAFQSSLSYRGAKIDWSDITKRDGEGKLKPYANSKRLLNLAIVALRKDFLKDYPNVRYSIAHPGCVISNIMGNAKKASAVLAKPFFHSAETASLSITQAALIRVPDSKLVGPWSLGIWGKPKIKDLDGRLFGEEQQENIRKVLKEYFPEVYKN